MKALSLKNIVNACHGTYYGCQDNLNREISAVTIDSRCISADSLFIAISGARNDGHDFIPFCLQNGCLCCISEHVVFDAPGSIIVVESSIQALKDIAGFYRSSLSLPIIGITGSVGKTGTKDMVAAVLSQKYRVHKTNKNFNNEIGMSMTLLGISDSDEIAVIEMGINHFGEMDVLASIARPDALIMTNIGPCHLENLVDLNGVLKAKSEVFKYMKKGSPVFLNGDEEPLSNITLINDTPPVFFGLKNQLDYYADSYVSKGKDGSCCVLHNGHWSLAVSINKPGRHVLYHVLSAAAIGRFFELSDEQIKAGIASVYPSEGRNLYYSANNITIVDDCYNANPISMKGSVESLCEVEGRCVAILGDMFELGADTEKMHADVGRYISTCRLDVLLTVGSLSKNIADSCSGNGIFVKSFPDKESLINQLPGLIKRNDTVLIKASHGMHFELIKKALETMEFV